MNSFRTRLLWLSIATLSSLEAFLGAPSTAQADPLLSLSSYLNQVRTQNEGVKGAETEASGARARSGESQLITAPTAFATVQYLNDNTPSATALATSAYSGATAQLGVSKLWDFGLNSKLSFNYGYTSPNITQAAAAQQAAFFAANPALAPLAGLISTTAAYTARPQLDLSYPLWGGFGGASTRAAKQAAESAALATSYSNAFSVKMSLAEAETAYWRLALAREVVLVSKDSLSRAEKIRDWNKHRAELNLADRSDYIQAEAAVKLRRLELEQAEDEERSASRALNTLRGIDSNTVGEAVQPVELSSTTTIDVPERARFREDVLAAREQSRLAEANATTGIEKNKPSLNLFGLFALNGRDPNSGTAIGNALGINFPTTIAGVNFSMPLDTGILSNTKSGYRREQVASDLTFDRKVFEQERNWTDLQAQLAEARDRLELARKIESVQKEKLEIERDRHRRGRTTTYQVLLFEQDFAQAQLTRINSEAVILRILAQMKTFSNTLNTPGVSSAESGTTSSTTSNGGSQS